MPLSTRRIGTSPHIAGPHCVAQTPRDEEDAEGRDLLHCAAECLPSFERRHWSGRPRTTLPSRVLGAREGAFDVLVLKPDAGRSASRRRQALEESTSHVCSSTLVTLPPCLDA